MLRTTIDQALASVQINSNQLVDLILAGHHSQHVRRQRNMLIQARVQVVSALFCVMTPVWAILDLVFLPEPLNWYYIAARLVAAAVFLFLAWPRPDTASHERAIWRFYTMMAVPPAFYIVHILARDMVQPGTEAAILTSLYALLPFIVVAGLSVFPLTLLEVAFVSLPVAVLTALGAWYARGMTIESYVGTLWLLALVIGVAAMSGTTQLNYMIGLVNRATRDVLTGAFTRRSGEESLDMMFRMSEKQNDPLAVIFVDLDHFKSINDDYGHEDGDNALRDGAEALKSVLRRGDLLVRWGGEEFVIVMAGTDLEGVRHVVNRIMENGLGMRPDGTPLTASMGAAERSVDQIHDWMHLVELADQRMYKAKHTGRDRCFVTNEEVIPGNHGAVDRPERTA